MSKLIHSIVRCAVLVTMGAAALAQAPDRSTPPEPGPAPALKLPPLQKLRLSNGLPVWVVELHEVPVAEITLLVSVGTASDPPDKFGVASLTAAMLTEGAGSRSTLEIADAVDFLGADISTSSTSDASAVRLHTSVARLADAVPLMADVALRPTFPQAELERLRRQRLTSILQARDDAATIAALAFARVIYGRSHRFGTATIGTAETMKSFTVDDLNAFYASAFRPDNGTLLVVGDVTPATIMPLLESGFGNWTSSRPAAARVRTPVVPTRTSREIYLVDKPGAPQSQIRIGILGVPRSTPDYFPIQVTNTILGGSFSSRLNLNLREEHGYAYGASSAFDMRAEPGPFVAAAGVQTDKTAESLTEFFNELNGIQQLVPDEELQRAKNYVALRFPGGFETTTSISRRLEEVITYRLPDDYFSHYVPNIAAVTAADVQRIARTYIQVGKLAVVVVGDRKVIEPGVRALALGPITTLELDDVLGPAIR